MENRELPKRRSWQSKFGWFSKAYVVLAFRAVRQEIRVRFQRLDGETLTLAEACHLARRIKDQRDLIRQVADSRNRKHARRLMRLIKKQRRKLLELAEKAGLDTSVLLFR